MRALAAEQRLLRATSTGARVHPTGHGGFSAVAVGRGSAPHAVDYRAPLDHVSGAAHAPRKTA
ncbi:hypothetical protein [Streptomyces lunalinharesii]|uniref:hypothetical protein n=1 Tax=Streptomyces lunalinharesii TaxID=333384 RepID=UPI0031D55DDF